MNADKEKTQMTNSTNNIVSIEDARVERDEEEHVSRVRTLSEDLTSILDENVEIFDDEGEEPMIACQSLITLMSWCLQNGSPPDVLKSMLEGVYDHLVKEFAEKSDNWDGRYEDKDLVYYNSDIDISRRDDNVLELGQ